MPSHLSLGKLNEEIRAVYASSPHNGEEGIRRVLDNRLGHLPDDEKIALVERLAESFCSDGPGVDVVGNEEVLTRICSLLLGRKVSQADLSSSELLERLAESLNTIFDTLNQLVALIQTTLGGGGVGEETIRQVIGVHLQGEDQTKSLESYLGQIKQAFWVAQEAFRRAADAKVQQILVELDPGQIKEEKGKGFKFGPMKKAESFAIYEEKYGKIRKWFDSGRFAEDFLREFEKNAQELSS